jgi:hypothetical protein
VSEDFKGKRKKYYPVACGKIEDRTIRAKEEGRCVGQSLVSFGAKHFTTERSGLEISGTRVAGLYIPRKYPVERMFIVRRGTTLF